LSEKQNQTLFRQRFGFLPNVSLGVLELASTAHQKTNVMANYRSG